MSPFGGLGFDVGGAGVLVLGGLVVVAILLFVWFRKRDRAREAAEEARRALLPPRHYEEGETRDLEPAEIRALRISYSPEIDGDPDPGEIVWAWVPYAENDGRGKDRPVLLIARIDERSFAGCYLSTKRRYGFVSVGRGRWDPQGRRSYLAPSRVLSVDIGGIRREGHVLVRDRFALAVSTVARMHHIGK